MSFVEPWQLRARFARSLSAMYGQEVPAYTTLVDVSREVNEAVAAAQGADAERLGSLDRVTAERHGAIRLGTPRELAQVARIFGAMGMFPVGYYDLRDAAPSPVPVVSTAFRPIAAQELARNPFRVFTSVLAVSDRRFFTAELQRRLERFLDDRVLFGPELLALADRAEAAQGLAAADADRFIELATRSFELSHEPVDEDWYRELERISAVAADIGGVASTHVNHLTPRVLDIDLLYRLMQERGVEMIDEIQGPPAWAGPAVLLRQTSFRALAEARLVRSADGTVAPGELRVRFGEVEARGIALTPAGRDVVDRLPTDPQAWAAALPGTEAGFADAGLAWFTAALDPAAGELASAGRRPPGDAGGLAAEAWVRLDPVVYEDFLPRSAAGIFHSNLTAAGQADATVEGALRDSAWLAGALGREVHDPMDLYAAQVEASWAAVRSALGVPG